MESQDDMKLRLELREARERLDALVADLRSVDAELEGLSTERRQHELLQGVCVALEELDGLGGADLFWRGRSGDADAGAHLDVVRGRIEGFEKGWSEIEERRLSILDDVDRLGEDADFLAGEVLEAERVEELKKHEWVIEREAIVPYVVAMMPWARGGDDDVRFRKSLAASLLLALLLGAVLPLVDLPIRERFVADELPDRMTRLVREERPLPPPIPVQEVKPLDVEKEVAPVEELAETVQPTPQEVAPQQPKKPNAGSQGILAFREKFSGLAKAKASDRLGANARISNSGDAPSGAPTRSMVTSNAAGGSGGINLASLSRSTGGGGGEGFEGVDVVQATSSIGTGGGSDRPLSGGPSAGRTDEEIQIVFDRHKSALYRLYNRELRNNPTLRGQMILKMTIEPDGSVSICTLQSSDLKSKTLSAQVVARVKTFDFGAKEGIAPVSILYPIDFLPAT
jgi:hypothetical protein